MEIIFLKPEYLWLLLSLPLLAVTHFFVLRYLKRRALKFANFEAIRRVVGPEGSSKNVSFLSKNIGLLIIRMLALFFIIVGLASPIVYYSAKTSSSSFVLAIDTSSSMLADDFQPSRLESAKSAALKFVEKTPSKTRIGLVSFSGSAFVESDLTDDKLLLSSKIKNLGVSSIGGTDIGSAIITSSNLLLKENSSKIIILITDGQSNVGVEPLKGAEYAKDKNIVVHTIGIGTQKGGSFLLPEIVSTLDEETLKKISELTFGSYFRAENPKSLEEAYQKIAEKSVQRISKNIGFELLLIAIILLFIEWSLMNTRYRTLP
ncbi:MAG: VWA domain-containing protein [Candidatus Woesearchaeota archaeon]